MIRRFFREYVKAHWPTILVIFLCSIVVAVLTAMPAGLMKYVVDDVLFRKDLTTLAWITGGILLMFLLKGIFFFAENYLMARIGQSVLLKLRGDVFRHLQYMPVRFFEDRNTGQIMSRVTSDIILLQNVIHASVGVVADALTILGLVGWILWLHIRLALLSFLVLPVIIYANALFGRRLRKISKSLQERIGDLTSVLAENISGIRTVKSNTAEEQQIAIFDRVNGENFRIGMKNAQTASMILPVIEFLNTLGLVVVLGTGGYLVITSPTDKSFTPGDLLSFLTALGMLYSPMKRLTNVNAYMAQMQAGLDRIYEVLDDPREDEGEAGGAGVPALPELPPIRGEVVFDDVTFHYPGSEHGVRSLRFTASPDRVTAIVGPSGSGKTTILNLLQRCYRPQGGRILIDGIDAAGVRLRSLRAQIGVVPQDPALFSGTLFDNLRFGAPDADLDRVVAASRMANAHEFVTGLPKGYMTEIGERGVKLSGGQRQRIAIARAILRDPRILLLDEATSALDTESESLVKEAIDRVMRGRTTFIVAHRLSTIRGADEILVVAGGTVVQRGTHESLLAEGGLYGSLYRATDADCAPARAAAEGSAA